jgi:hypothetical protein
MRQCRSVPTTSRKCGPLGVNVVEVRENFWVVEKIILSLPHSVPYHIYVYKRSSAAVGNGVHLEIFDALLESI